MSERVVIDASALLALIQEEPGSEVIKLLINKAVISTVNLTEVLTVLQRLSFRSEEALDIITAIVNSVVPFTIEHSKVTADLYDQTKSKGLSLGDRACLALGIILQAPIYTADKIWKELSLPGAQIHLIR